MLVSQSAKENGWLTYPADVWNADKPGPVGPHEFWTYCAQKYGTQILEVACGTGRWLFPLAELGYECVGVDVNAEFVASARDIARESGAANVSFEQADIVNLDLKRKFPLAIMTSWTFQILLTQDDQLSFLHRLHEHITPGGAFAFNHFMPLHRQRALIELDDGYYWPNDPSYHGGCKRSYDPVTQIETLIEIEDHPIKLRHTSLAEIELLFRLTGFKIAEIYGDDEDMRPFTGRADTDYTIIAERT